MSGKPTNYILSHYVIHKVQKHYEELREKIQLTSSQSYHDKWLAQIPTFEHLSFHNSICIVLWDVIANRFLFAVDEKKLVQYDMSLYTAEKGVVFSLNNFHPDHINAVHLMGKCFSEHLDQMSGTAQNKAVATIDALYRIADGSYIHLFQQIIPVEKDANGQPFLFLSYIRDITHLKKQPSSALVIVTPDESKLWNYSFSKRELEPVIYFTPQERKVLTLLSEGKQTKQIAETLSLSRHTVDTYRRRMLAKTNCVDTTALTVYCELTGLI